MCHLSALLEEPASFGTTRPRCQPWPPAANHTASAIILLSAPKYKQETFPLTERRERKASPSKSISWVPWFLVTTNRIWKDNISKKLIPSKSSWFCSVLHLNTRYGKWTPRLFSYPLGNHPEIRRFSGVKQRPVKRQLKRCTLERLTKLGMICGSQHGVTLTHETF